MNENDDLVNMLGGPVPAKASDQSELRVQRALKRANTSLGQQQTLGFLLIKVWVTFAKVLAPFFAGLAKRQAENIRNQNQFSRSNGENNGNS